jgi:hypothetical protein
MRNLEMFEIEAVSGSGWLSTVVKFVAGNLAWEAATNVGSLNEGGKAFEEGDPSLVANTFGA